VGDVDGVFDDGPFEQFAANNARQQKIDRYIGLFIVSEILFQFSVFSFQFSMKFKLKTENRKLNTENCFI
jgi:hypothetical protein